jgi:hypothetical protein
MEMKPHKHAEVIKAWADGAEIEHNLGGNSPWKATKDPMWYTDSEYRVKPPERESTKWLWADSTGRYSNHFREDGVCEFIIKLEWSETEFEVE